MKAGRVAIVGTLFIAMLVVSGASADEPQGQGKPGKPPWTSKECIVFTGDLDGKQVVEGCCPNRGPFPAYTMTLSEGILEDFEGTYDGHLFVNQYGPGRVRRQYMVEFWTDLLHFVVIGGDINEDTKNTLVVDFDDNNSVCDDYSSGTYQPCQNRPTFRFVRTSDLSFCSWSGS